MGLVLSGGGAKGLAHVGVLKVLEEMKIPVDIIVGTSAGSAVAGLYAMGMSVDEIEERFHAMDWNQGFTDESSRNDMAFRRKQDDFDFATDLVLGVGAEGVKFRKGLIQGQQLMLILSDMTNSASHIEHFDEFPIRYRAVASDIETGETVAIDKGNLALAMRASMSIPGAFPPVEYERHLLVDGGISNNLPIDVARDLGAEVIIAVDISSPLLSGDDVNSLVGVVEQLTNLLTRRNAEAQIATLTEQDILLVPNLEDAGSGDFDRSDELVEMGATAARANALALKALSVKPAQWLAYQQQRSRLLRLEQPIDRIEIVNQSNVADEFISSRISQSTGAILNQDALENDINNIYGLGYFERVSYDIVAHEGQNILNINAVEKSWGPDYLRFGLNFEDSFQDNTHFNLTLHYDQTALNKLGAEWQTSLQIGSSPFLKTEFFQPLSYISKYFVALGGVVSQRDINLFESGSKVSEWELTEMAAQLSLGREFGNDAELRLVYEVGEADAELEVGKEPIDNLSDSEGSLTTRFMYDSLDKLYFPHQGVFSQLEWKASRERLAASQNYDRVSGLLGAAYSLERYSLVARLRATTVTKNEASIGDFATLGGLFNLSGYGRDELSGQDASLASVIFYQEFGGPLVPYMLGFSYEIGNVWDDLTEASWGGMLDSYTVFVGSDTPLGPVTFAASYADNNHHAIYLTIGYELFSLF